MKTETMKVCTACLTLALFATSWCSAIPKEQQKRVHDRPLSDQEHEINGEHNNDYDHDAFLGQDEADEYDQLSPEESKSRLAIIVDKIDRNRDGFVTEEELKSWIQYVQKRYLTTDTDKMWAQHDTKDNVLTWESYQKHTYGTVGDDVDSDFRDMISRDKRRWDAADKNQDGALTKEEFTDFLHPEEVEHMKDIVVTETIEDIDKDKDGYISLEEYIADIVDEDDEDDEDENDEDNKEWINSERDQFRYHRDVNGDGKLDRDEVQQWVMPDDYDHSDAEARHLVFTSDADKDGKLSKEEILNKYEVFVGSQATDFGEALARHDEF